MSNHMKNHNKLISMLEKLGLNPDNVITQDKYILAVDSETHKWTIFKYQHIDDKYIACACEPYVVKEDENPVDRLLQFVDSAKARCAHRR